MRQESEALEQRLLALLDQARAEGDEQARIQLNALLRENADARKVMAQLLVDEQSLIGHLRTEGITALIKPASNSRTIAVRPRWFWRRWPSLTAAAAGLVVGLFGGSFVWAEMIKPTMRVEYRLDEDFENAQASFGKKFPRQADLWSGDLEAPIEATGTVRPKSGHRMVALPATEKRRFSYAWRSFDLKAMGLQSDTAALELQVSANFHGSDPALAERIQIRLVAFSETPQDAALVWINNRISDDALAHTMKMDPVASGAKGWRTISANMSIPPNTRTLLVSLAAGATEIDGPKSTHYLDDVKIQILSRERQ